MSVVQVVCAIVEKSGRILLARRAPGQNLAGFWEFPGGKIEPGETEIQALERELHEELSIRVHNWTYVARNRSVSGEKTIELIAYTGRWQDGEIVLNVHDAYAWVEVDRVSEYRLADADIPLWERYRQTLPAAPTSQRSN